MPDNPVAVAANWTVTHLYRVVDDVAVKARAEKAKLLANRTRVADLFKRVQQIPDQAVRDKAYAEARKVSAHVAQQIVDYQKFTQTWNATTAKVTAFLKSVGLAPPSAPQLSGLEGLPLVPIAIAAAVAIAAAFVASMALKNGAVANAIDLQNKLYNAYMDGKLTFDQYQQAAKQAADSVDRASSAANKGSLEETLRAALPVVIAVAAILLLPTIMQAFPRRRAAA